jgi:hypothetical protein
MGFTISLRGSCLLFDNCCVVLSSLLLWPSVLIIQSINPSIISEPDSVAFLGNVLSAKCFFRVPYSETYYYPVHR